MQMKCDYRYDTSQLMWGKLVYCQHVNDTREKKIKKDITSLRQRFCKVETAILVYSVQ